MRGPAPALLGAVLLVGVSAAAAAQDISTKVAAETATLHARCDPSSPTRAQLRRGEPVTVEAVTEGWANVRVDATGERGCLRRRELEPSAAIDRAGEARREREIERARAAAGMPATPQPRPAAPAGRPIRVSAFATAGVFNAAASETFEAILDTRSGLDIGGGAQVAFLSGPLRGLFAEVGVSRFEETGERVFVHEGEVFPLGIPLTVSLTPIEVTAGYRIAPVRRVRGRAVESPVAYFAGGGVGSVGYVERDDEEEISERFTAWHVMGGADARVWRFLLVGGEVRYRWVPDGLGSGGVSDEFNETDLGGATFRIRIGVTF